MYVLIDDGSAIRPPIGSVTLRNVASRPKPSASAGLAVARRHRLEAGAEVLGVEGAAPDHHREPGDRERVEEDPDLREREEEHEDLDEDRRVADDLDVDGRELADDRDPVGAGRAEHEPDRRTRRRSRSTETLSVLTRPSSELVAVLRRRTPRGRRYGEDRHRADERGAAASTRPLPSVAVVQATGTPCRRSARRRVPEVVVRPEDVLRERRHEPRRRRCS